MPREIMLALVQAVTVFSLILMIIEVLIVAAQLVFKKRKERIAFLRSFKNGKFAVIYLTAFPLWWVGHVYSGQNPLEAFFYTINEILSLVVVKYEVGSISKLMGDSDTYRYAVYFCFVMVVINALLFTISLTMQHLWSGARAVRALFTRKSRLYLFGNNDGNISIYHSDKKREKVVIDELSNEECEKLYMDAVAYINSPSIETRVTWLLKLVKKLDRENIIVINTGDDKKNISICRSVIDGIQSSPDSLKDRLFLKLKVYVFGDPRYQALYEDIVTNAHGCIHYINKYQKIAMDYIDRYPLSLFMDERQVDYSTSLVREDVNINVIYVGFGKTNQQILLASVANNQFLTNGDSGPVLKPVNYFIFDRKTSENNKNLNHSYYRFRNECDNINEADYLPMPSLPAQEYYYHLDINDPKFYNDIRSICTKNKNDANFLVIAYGNDLENLDMAQKLVEKRKEWGIDNLKIFVRAFDWNKDQTLIKDDSCFFIGNEQECVFDIEKLLSDSIYKMAKMRNRVYDLEYEISKDRSVATDEARIQTIYSKADRNWYKKKSQMERDSSLYCCLSLRSKLHLMGLDYTDDAKAKGLTYDEYISTYATKDDKPDIKSYDILVDDKPMVKYDLKFKDTRRKNMAIHEHQRWNSFMISRGMIPATKDQILNETKLNEDGELEHTNGKNYALRRHGNLTTFDGLVEFRRMVAKRDNKDEEKKDVIKYDYQILDDAHWLLTQNGYKIVRRK